jgi:hypothetical protein
VMDRLAVSLIDVSFLMNRRGGWKPAAKLWRRGPGRNLRIRSI